MACRSEKSREGSPPAWQRRAAAAASAAALATRRSAEKPAARPSAVVEFEKSLERSKLELAPRSFHEPKLAFGRGALGQLAGDSFVVYDLRDFKPLLREPLERPRAVLTLADGGLLAVGARDLLVWQPGWEHTKNMRRPTLLPGVELYADAQRGDRFWVFDGRSAELRGYQLEPGASLLLDGQVFQLDSPAGGVLGLSREAVWLYLTPGRLERRAPNGERLSVGPFPDAPRPTWILPARRLDEAWLLEASGRLSHWLLTATARELRKVELGASVLAADVGRDGQLFAAVLVRYPGPRFDLELRGPDLASVASVPLPSDPPNGQDDWVALVTRNQELCVAQHEGRVAVGGPDRVLVFDAQGRRLFSSSSK
jgi:hypothetical protein